MTTSSTDNPVPSAKQTKKKSESKSKPSDKIKPSTKTEPHQNQNTLSGDGDTTDITARTVSNSTPLTFKTIDTSTKVVSSDAEEPKVSSKPAKSKGQKISKKMAALEAELNDDDFPALPICSEKKATVNGKSKVIDDDFPSLSAAVPDKSISQPTTKLNDVNLTAQMSGFSLDDYPSLAISVSAGTMGVSAKPPPGLGSATTSGTSVKPPPGLNLSAPVKNGNRTPPGIDVPAAPLNISSLASLITPNAVIEESGGYLEPVNFAQRNKKLSFKLKALIYNNMDQFHKFRNYTVDFRENVITASKFFTSCCSLLGKDVFLEILPELIVLLPDLSKQQALYSVCIDELDKFQQERKWSINDNTLTQCAMCKQVLLPFDAVHHETQHGAQMGDFPALSNPPAVKKAW